MSSSVSAAVRQRLDGYLNIWLFLSSAVITALIVSTLLWVIGDRLAIAFVLLLWGLAFCTAFLPSEKQMLVLWVILPFVDVLKRMVWLDPSAGSFDMYMVLLTQDIILVTVLLKTFLSLLRSDLKVRYRPVDVAVALFGLYSLFSALMTPRAPMMARLAAVGMQVWPVITYFLAVCYLSGWKQINLLTKLTTALALIVALYGIRQFFGGMLPFEALWFERAGNSNNVTRLQYELARGVFRTFGTLDSHSSYGIFLGTGLVLTWARRPRIGWLSWLLSSAVIAFGLILSFTRFTWLMPLLAAGYAFLFHYRRIKPVLSLSSLRRGSLLLLAVVGSFAIFSLLMSSAYGMKLTSSDNPYLRRAFGTGTLEARLKSSRILTSENLTLTGKGLAATSLFADKFGFESNDVNFHDIFIDMVDSMGLIGLTIFIALLYLLIKQGLTNLRAQTNRQQRRTFIAIFSLILAMLTVGHFNGAVFYFGRALPCYFWGLCGILAHYNKHRL